QDDETVSRVDEVADEDLPAQLGRDRERQRGCAEHDAQALLDHHREPEGQEQAQNRIGAVEAAKQQPLDRDADETDGERRHDERAREPDAVRQDDREIGADRVKATVREIDDAAEREDQRQAERDQKVISADQEAVENLLEYEDELHATISWRVNTSRLISSYYVVPAKAGTHIPEPVIMGPQHKRVYARLRHAMRGDDKTVMRGLPLCSPDFAAAVLRRGDDLQVLVRAGDRAERFVDVPLVLHLGRLLGAHRVHLHDHLVVIGTEVRFARLHHVEFRALA